MQPCYEGGAAWSTHGPVCRPFLWGCCWRISRRSKVGGGYDVVDDEEAGDVLYLIVASGKSIRNRSAGFRERLGDGERHHFLLCQVIHCFLTTWV